MVPRSLVMLAAVWTNNASMSSSCCSVASLIVAPFTRLARLGPWRLSFTLPLPPPGYITRSG